MAASYAYNGLGQRVKKVVNGSASYYLYSNSGLLSREFDSNGSLLRDYIYLNGQLIGLINHSGDDAYTISYVHNNHLNTPIKVTDETGNIAWSANYKPFGQVDLEVENIVLNVRFPGQYYDYEKTSYYNYFRDYNPETGRYIQSDPIGLSGGINTYGYVGGNPIHFIDPMGLSYLTPLPGSDLCKALQEIAQHENNTFIDGSDLYMDELATETKPFGRDLFDGMDTDYVQTSYNFSASFPRPVMGLGSILGHGIYIIGSGIADGDDLNEAMTDMRGTLLGNEIAQYGDFREYVLEKCGCEN